MASHRGLDVRVAVDDGEAHPGGPEQGGAGEGAVERIAVIVHSHDGHATSLS